MNYTGNVVYKFILDFDCRESYCKFIKRYIRKTHADSEIAEYDKWIRSDKLDDLMKMLDNME